MSASLLCYLRVLGLQDKEDLSLEDLKKAFRLKVIQAHPDKGGDANVFDYILSAFIYISNTICRVKGGRATASDIKTPDELRADRLNDFIVSVFDEYSRELSNNSYKNDFDIESFNKEFEKQHISDLNDGYLNWLSADSEKDKEKDKEKDSKNGLLDYQILLKRSLIPKNLELSEITDINSVFVREAKKGKPEPQSIILHPNAMAYHQGPLMGTSLIGLGERPDTYTSDFLSNPEFTDLYQAYTNENTICDKVSDNILNRTLDEIMKEREEEVNPLTDEEKSTLFEYERKQLQKEKERIDKLNETYKTNYKYNTTFLENTVLCGEGSFIREINYNENSFIKEIKRIY